MTSPASLVCLVCPNGLGHYRRVIGILSRVRERCPTLQLTVLCDESQVQRAASWDRARRFWDTPGIRRIGGVMSPGVRWTLDADELGHELLAWVDRLASVAELGDADVVVSDNLAGVLAHRGDAVLIGSFLWSDVLAEAYPNHPAVQSFVEHERTLLSRYTPPMLCVRDIVMPGVVERARAIPLPWMCEDASAAPRSRGSRPRIAVLGGATGSADELVGDIRRTLLDDGRWEVVEPFGYAAADYASLDLAVCRPGIGTITDCIAHQVPMLVLHEGASNPELAHNGRRLAAAGLARDLGAEPSMRAVVDAIEQLLEPAVISAMRTKLGGVARDGLDRAADELVSRLPRSGEP